MDKLQSHKPVNHNTALADHPTNMSPKASVPDAKNNPPGEGLTLAGIKELMDNTFSQNIAAICADVMATVQETIQDVVQPCLDAMKADLLKVINDKVLEHQTGSTPCNPKSDVATENNSAARDRTQPPAKKLSKASKGLYKPPSEAEECQECIMELPLLNYPQNTKGTQVSILRP